MTNTFFKSFVSSIQTATAAYFSPNPARQPVHHPFEAPDTPTAMAPEGGKREIYRDVVFYDGSSCLTEEHRRMLLAGGAREYEGSGGEVEWEEISHLFTENVDFPGRMEAEKVEGLVSLTPRWVEVSSKRSVLQNPKSFSPDPKMFFSGIVVTCAELPDGDREAIFGGFQAYGGMFDDNLRITTTHVIALDTNNEKCRKALKEEKLGIKIVLPHWFDDSLKLRRRVDEKPYLLPNPPLYKFYAEKNSGVTPSIEPGPSDHLAYTHFGTIRAQSSPPACTVKIFKGNRKTVFLARDLCISARLRATLETAVSQVGGKLVDRVDGAQVYVGAFREKDDYVLASRAGAVVGNLTWLYYMLANEKWISPRCHLLHYPLVRGGMQEMKEFIMTVTNFQGEARAYLEKLIEACGAKFTRNMTTENTHLIAASKSGEKCKHANEWGISVVNHLWLEETYAKWQVQSVTVPRYTHFPPVTNLTEIVDKTEIQDEGILDFYMPGNEEDDDVLVAETVDTAVPKTKDVASSYAHTSEPKNTPAPSSRRISPSGSVPRELAGLQTPGLTGEMVSGTPGSTKRRAAENAMTKLHNEVMPDVLLWEKEKNRKRFPSDVVPAAEEDKKKKSEKRKVEEKENFEGAAAKKVKKDGGESKGVVESKVTLLITGASDEFNASCLKKLSKLGIKIGQEGGFCTHLAAPHILRTEKFLCALAYAPTVVSLDWVSACIDQDTILDTEGYLLRDRENEAKYGTKLEQTVARARENNRQLFKPYQIYVASNVPGLASLRRIIEANGGEVRAVSNAIKGRAKVLRSDYLRTVDQILVCTDSTEDAALRGKFEEEVREGGMPWAMYTSEWIMKSVLKQEIANGAGLSLT